MGCQLRFPYIDKDNVEACMKLRAEHTPRALAAIQAEPDKPQYRRFASLTDDYVHRGLMKYALGCSNFCEIRALLSRGISFSIRLFRSRGTHSAFPAYDLYVDSAKPRGDPERARLTQRYSPGTKDYSLTNSKD